MQPLRTVRSLTIFIATGLLLFGFAFALSGLQSESLWLDEAWSAWLVHDDPPTPDGLRDALRHARDGLLRVFQRVRNDDVHPPLYYLLLDGWTFAFGESVLALRLPSLFAGMLALAATFTIGRRLFWPRAGLMGLSLLLSTGFFVYYAREARMYSLLLALSTVSVLAYLHWRQRRTVWRGALLGVSWALMIYTHYLGALLIGVLLLHNLAIRATDDPPLPGRVWRLAWPSLISSGLFLPWVPTLISQIQSNPYNADAIATNLNTVYSLLLVLTSGIPWFMTLLLLSGLIIARREWAHPMPTSLLLLWLLLPPGILLLINVVQPIYQVRYLLIVLPAMMLLLAGALHSLGARADELLRLALPDDIDIHIRWLTPYNIVVATGLIMLVLSQFGTYTIYWPAKPRWGDAVQQAAQTRDAIDPAITIFTEHSPVAYYDRQYKLTDGISIDVGWRRFTPAEVRAVADNLADVPRVWAFVTASDPAAWDALRALSSTQERGVSYRDSVRGMLFYQFDRAADEGLRLRFADLFTVTPADNAVISVAPGACLRVPLRASQAVPAGYSVGLYLTQGYADVLHQSDTPIPALAAGTTFTPELCIRDDLPAQAGEYHLRVAIYARETVQRLPLLEGDAGLLWGDYLVWATVSADAAGSGPAKPL